jgi:hypothetical protein
MVEKADDSACAIEVGVGLELGMLPFSRLLATHHPWAHVYRKITKTWNWCDPRNGGFVGLPGAIKVDSCTKLHIFAAMSGIQDHHSEVPDQHQLMGTIGDMMGKLSMALNIREGMLRSYSSSCRYVVKVRGQTYG